MITEMADIMVIFILYVGRTEFGTNLVHDTLVRVNSYIINSVWSNLIAFSSNFKILSWMILAMIHFDLQKQKNLKEGF